MSKKLLKILAICIFVTLIPVAVVAIALAATLSAPYTIAVEFKGTDAALEATYPAAANISVNDKLKDGNSVGVKMDDKITITLADGAYEVVGFYAGNAESVTADSEKLTDSLTSYSFNATDSATITIWVEAKLFNITYTTDTEESVTGGTMTYGSELATSDRVDFVGWTVTKAPEGVATNSKIYKQATFPVSGAYTLAPCYEDITYTANVKLHESAGEEDETSQVTVNLTDGFSSYNVTRENYTFVGFNHNGIVYKPQTNEGITDYFDGETSLAQVIASSYKEGTTVELTAVWTNDYVDKTFVFSLSARHGEDSVYYYDDNVKDYVAFDLIEPVITFDDKTNYDLNDTLAGFFFQGKDPVLISGSESSTGKYTIYFATTEEGFQGDLIMYSTNTPENVTFADILAAREDKSSQIITIVFDFN